MMMRVVQQLLLLLPLLSVASAWMPNAASSSRPATLVATTTTLSRFDFIKTVAATATATAVVLTTTSAVHAETLSNGVEYQIKKSGSGPKPEVGELAAIRFSAYYGNIKIDDIFDTAEPYYTRVGSGALLKGVEQVLPQMRLGDRWVLIIPPELAFGKKGRSASAGKPRIPGDATITFEVEMVGLPGKEPELIELIGDV